MTGHLRLAIYELRLERRAKPFPIRIAESAAVGYFGVMRKQTLQSLEKIFRTYVRTTAIMWLGLMLLNLLLAFVIFPSGRDGNLWPAFEGTTGGCIIVLLVVAVLKSVFHKRVIRALEDRRGSDA